MNLYENQFLEDNDFSQDNRKIKTLVIASTPRCGSHMLGHALYETGCFGFPLEYLNPSNLKKWKSRFGENDTDKTLDAIESHRTSDNGVFSIKLHYSHINQLGNFGNVCKRYPDALFVLINRSDVLDQAISLSIAKQTGVWISGQQPTNSQLVYNQNEIENSLKTTLLDNTSWRYSLSANGCNYIELDFSNVVKDLPGTITKLAETIGIEIKPDQVPTQQVTKKQKNEINEIWKKAFIDQHDNNSLCFDFKTFLLHYKNNLRRFLKR